MQKILAAAEMREVDRRTTENYGIPSLLLMESAANAAARVICEQLGGTVSGKSVLIFCGRGNNGGDGAALARLLWSQGADVEVCLFGQVENTAGDSRVNFEILRKISDAENFNVGQSDLAFEEISSLEEWIDYDTQNFQGDDPDVIVDALFGTGLSRPLDGVFEQAAELISAFCTRCGEAETTVVSLDLPSGLMADSAECRGSVVQADLTVTFTSPKLANVMPPSARCGGDLIVANIGSPRDLIDAASSQTFLAESSDVAEWLAATKFTDASYKNKRGHLLVIGGSRNYAGAAALCGNAAMHGGCGLVTVATPLSAAVAVATQIATEVMVRPVAETPRGAVSLEAAAEIFEFWDKVDCVALGSGLSSSDESTRTFVLAIVKGRRTPLIIDADGLNLLAPFQIAGTDDLPLILTPHEGEFLRLIGSHDRDLLKNRIDVARGFAERHRVYLVLKGERPIIVEPGGRVAISPTGNSGLGKAGNGDTLCGLVGAFVSQAAQMKLPLFETLTAAVYFAGLAGDIAERKVGKRAMIASDVVEAFADGFEVLT